MEKSLGKLALALSKAQAEIKGAKKDTINPFFKVSYADLASVWDACKEPLSKNELAIVQTTEIMNGAIVLRTTLLHSSGEYITGDLPIMVGEKSTAQQLGSAITYNRRYALAAMVGVAPEDDDGNAAGQTEAKSSGFSKPAPPKPTLQERATAFELHLDKLQSLLSVTNLIAANNQLLSEMKKMQPQNYENLMIKIGQIEESFKMADSKDGT